MLYVAQLMVVGQIDQLGIAQCHVTLVLKIKPEAVYSNPVPSCGGITCVGEAAVKAVECNTLSYIGLHKYILYM